MKTQEKTNYINRLIDCGYSCFDACELYRFFKYEGMIEELDHFVKLLEKEKHVDSI